MSRIYNVDLRQAVCHLGDHTVVFRPRGKITCHDSKALRAEASKAFSKGGLSARILMGLSVGEESTYTVDDVIDAIKTIRKRQKLSPNASIISQKGIYEDKKHRIIVEDSVQIVIIDMDELTYKEFVKQIIDLAEEMVDEFEQEGIVVEFQKKGVVKELYEVTPDDDEEEDDEEEGEEDE
jgi:hypothetical protein